MKAEGPGDQAVGIRCSEHVTNALGSLPRAFTAAADALFETLLSLREGSVPVPLLGNAED